MNTIINNKYTIDEIAVILNNHENNIETCEDNIETCEDNIKLNLDINNFKIEYISNNGTLLPDPNNQLKELETEGHIFYKNKVWSKLTSKNRMFCIL